MDVQKVDMFLMAHGQEFPEYQIPVIRERLLALDDNRWAMVSAMQFHNPTLSLILSIVLGAYGIDRFFIGDMGIGLGKLLTCGGLGVWAIVDWFLISGATREKNYAKLSAVL